MRAKVRIRHYLDGGTQGTVGHLEMNDKGKWHLVVREGLDLETVQGVLADRFSDYFTHRQVKQGDRVLLELDRRPTIDFLCAVQDLAKNPPRTEAAA